MVVIAAVDAVPFAGAADGRPGVTATQIRVGGVASVTGAPGVGYAAAFDGVAAYFDTVNTAGGVFGRRLRLVARIDDGSRASKNLAANRALVERRRVFAVAPEATPAFAAGSYLAQAGTPTFGWNVSSEWSGKDALFGEKGSYVCSTCPAVAPAYLAIQLGATKVGVLAPPTPEGTACGAGLLDGFAKYGFEVVVVDTRLTSDLTGFDADLKQINDQGAELLASCRLGVGTLAKVAGSLRGAGLGRVRIYAQEAYDPTALARDAESLDGVFAGVGFVPWESASSSNGTRAFLAAMKRRGLEPTEAAQAGWINAQLLVEGIKKAGKSFTQQTVIAAINAMTDFTAGGILPGIDWANGGHGPGREVCTAFVEAVHGRFVPRFGKPGQPFACFPDNPLPGALDAPYLRPLAPGTTVPPTSPPTTIPPPTAPTTTGPPPKSPTRSSPPRTSPLPTPATSPPVPAPAP